MTKIVCISDTHNRHRDITLPEGDILVHAGDSTNMGRVNEVEDFLSWFNDQDYKEKIMIAGNHDFLFQNQSKDADNLLKYYDKVIYLEDSSYYSYIHKLWFYGSPWQPTFHNWAFNLDIGPKLKAKWDAIPKNTDVLITHSPPYGILDRTQEGNYTGCPDLRRKIFSLQIKLNVFGHIHEAYGKFSGYDNNTIFVNASICNRRVQPINKPIVIEV